MNGRARSARFFILTLVGASLAALLMGSIPNGKRLRWTGCGITRKAFMIEAARAYLGKTGTVITLSGGGATKGIRDPNKGFADLGGSCRPALTTRFPKEEGDVYMTLVAWDALVPIVNASNPASDLTRAQLRDIFLGRITNWKEVGGDDRPIVVVARAGKISGVGYMTRKILFNDPEVEYTSSAIFLASSGPVEKRVMNDPQAIAITGISSAQKMLREGKPIKVLSLDGLRADVASISSGAYFAFRPLYLMTKGAPTGLRKEFLDWLTSDEGQEVVERAGTVSLRQGKGLKEKFRYWENTDRILNFASLP
ncbi:MAG: hypothetical protein Kow0089_18870 [Desulfobulbaceae bacterium]